MFRPISSLIIGVPSLILTIFHFTNDMTGMGILYGGVTLIVIINYVGRELESRRASQDGNTRGAKPGKHTAPAGARSKPIGIILLYILGTPTVLAVAGMFVGNVYEQTTLGYVPGLYPLFLMVGGAVFGLAVGAALAVK
jgi:hypothetical protein